MNPPDTKTPRTDSAAVTQNLSWGQIGMVTADFARTLERELAEAKHKHEINCSQIRVMAADLEDIRARLLLADRMADEAEDVVTNAEEAYAHRVSTLGILGNLKPAVNAYRAAKERKA